MRRAVRSVVLAALGLTIAASAAGGTGTGPGELDTSFGGDGVVEDSRFRTGSDVAVARNGNIVAVGIGVVTRGTQVGLRFGVVRYRPTGAIDRSFARGGQITHFGSIFGAWSRPEAVALSASGRIVVAGTVCRDRRCARDMSGPSGFGIARYRSDGRIDRNFGVGGKVVTRFGNSSRSAAHAVALAPDGEIVAAGSTGAGPGVRAAIARYRADGRLDRSFGRGGKVVGDRGSWIEAIALTAEGKILTLGGTVDAYTLVRYRRDGTRDPTFGENGAARGSEIQARALAIRPDGTILLAGSAILPDGRHGFAAAAYTAEGRVDRSFGVDGKAVTTSDRLLYSYDATDVTVAADGKIVVGGRGSDGDDSKFAIARYEPNGTLDRSFGTSGVTETTVGCGILNGINALAFTPSGKLVAVGDGRCGAPGKELPYSALARYLTR